MDKLPGPCVAFFFFGLGLGGVVLALGGAGGGASAGRHHVLCVLGLLVAATTTATTTVISTIGTCSQLARNLQPMAANAATAISELG